MDADFDADFDDAGLDALLRQAAPHHVGSTPRLSLLLDEMVEQAMVAAAPGAVARRRNRRRRTAFVGLGLVAATGIGVGAAAATGMFSSPSPKTSSWFTEEGVVHIGIPFTSGQTCEVTIAPVPFEPSTDAGDRWEQAMAAAHNFMKSVDVSSISISADVAAYRASEPADELATETTDDIRVAAVASQLSQQMQDSLERQGLPADAITIATGRHACGDGNQ